MSNSRIWRWVTAALEAVLAIPILGGAIVLGLWYVPLVIMLVLHIVTLVLSSKNNEPRYGSITGIITSLLAWIPILGWLLHITSAILLIISAVKSSPKSQENFYQSNQ